MFIRFAPAPRRVQARAIAKNSVGLERRAADQTAVDIRHREQRRRVVRLDAAAVQQRHVRRARLRQPRAQHRVHRLRLLRRRRPPGADRPDRLVGDHELRRIRADAPPAPRRAAAARPPRSPRRRAPRAFRRRTRSASVPPPAPPRPSPRRPHRCRRRTAGAPSARRSRSGSRTRPASAPTPRRCTRRTRARSRPARPTRSATPPAPRAPAPDTGYGTHTAICRPGARLPAGRERREQRRVGREPAVHLPVADDEFAAHCDSAPCRPQRPARQPLRGCGCKSLKLYRSAAKGGNARPRATGGRAGGRRAPAIRRRRGGAGGAAGAAGTRRPASARRASPRPGASKKASRLPSDLIIDVTKFSSSMPPSTTPRIAGAIGKPFSSST